MWWFYWLLRSESGKYLQPDLTITCCLFKATERHAGLCGARYSAAWADKLYRGIRRNFSGSLRFVCITDFPHGDFEEKAIEAVPFLCDDHVGTWMCLNEVFRPDLHLGRTLFMGLDTLITGSIDELAKYDGPMAQTWYPPHGDPENPDGLWCNAVVSYTGESGAHLWTNYRRDPEGVVARSIMPWSHGEGSEMVYWREECEHPIDCINPEPGVVVSWGLEILKGIFPIEKSSIVYFHGASKPDLIPAELQAKYWA